VTPVTEARDLPGEGLEPTTDTTDREVPRPPGDRVPIAIGDLQGDLGLAGASGSGDAGAPADAGVALDSGN
jgi:hypothetical protein